MMAISASFLSGNFNLASGFSLSPLRASPPILARYVRYDGDVLKGYIYAGYTRSGSWNPPEAVINGHRTWTLLADTKSLKLMTAIKTPYLPDGRIDFAAYDSLLQMQIESGIEGVIVGGITGEGHIMSRDERIMLIGHTVNSFGGSLKVIGNTGSNSTNEAIRATEQGFTVGMHAALHMNPYYGKTARRGELSHFRSVLPLGPTIIHNVPTRTAQDIAPQLIDLISDHPNMLGVKECTGIIRIQQHVQRGLAVWSGNDNDGHYAVCESGARGVISVASNLVPGLMRDLMYKGKNPQLEHKLEPLFRWLSLQPNPICLNTALAQLGVVRPVFRLPYVPLPAEQQMEFRDIVLKIGRVNFVGKRDIGVLQEHEFKMLPRY